jgi:hypothetical protein
VSAGRAPVEGRSFFRDLQEPSSTFPARERAPLYSCNHYPIHFCARYCECAKGCVCALTGSRVGGWLVGWKDAATGVSTQRPRRRRLCTRLRHVNFIEFQINGLSLMGMGKGPDVLFATH